LKNPIVFSVHKQIFKICISIFITNVIKFLLNWAISRSNDNQTKIFDAILGKDKKLIQELRKEYEIQMIKNYICFYFTFILVSLIILYYNTIFCSVYIGSSLNWLSDGFIAILLDLLFIQIIIITLLALTRTGLRRFKNR